MANNHATTHLLTTIQQTTWEIYIWVFPKNNGTPKSSIYLFIEVWNHDFHHPFCFFSSPYFLVQRPISIVWDNQLGTQPGSISWATEGGRMSLALALEKNRIKWWSDQWVISPPRNTPFIGEISHLHSCKLRYSSPYKIHHFDGIYWE